MPRLRLYTYVTVDLIGNTFFREKKEEKVLDHLKYCYSLFPLLLLRFDTAPN